MWSVICSMLLAGLPAPIPDAPVWTIAADGSMVELYAVPEVIQEVTIVIEEGTVYPDHPHGPGPVRVDEMADGRIKRLPGPSWWHCPTCGSSTCRMYLGGHLANRRGEHKITNDKLNQVGNRNWYVFHDNLHNAKLSAEGIAKWKARQASSSGCKDGFCNVRQRHGVRIFQRLGGMFRGRR